VASDGSLGSSLVQGVELSGDQGVEGRPLPAGYPSFVSCDPRVDKYLCEKPATLPDFGIMFLSPASLPKFFTALFLFA